MEVGVSSACFYPLETEKGLIKLGELGVHKAEVFINSPSELKKEFLDEICKIKSHYGIDIVSVHPFTSIVEGFHIFSDYERRFSNSLEDFKLFFEATATVGAKYFVLHGARIPCKISNSEYAERLYRFSSVAEEFGITVAHENVVDYIGQSPKFLSFLKSELGEKFKAVLDIKQTRLSMEDPYKFIEVLGTNIVHLHLSDYGLDSLCTPPKPNGNFDFKRFFEALAKIGYKGDAVVELYRSNFKEDAELKTAMDYLNSLL